MTISNFSVGSEYATGLMKVIRKKYTNANIATFFYPAVFQNMHPFYKSNLQKTQATLRVAYI